MTGFSGGCCEAAYDFHAASVLPDGQRVQICRPPAVDQGVVSVTREVGAVDLHEAEIHRVAAADPLLGPGQGSRQAGRYRSAIRGVVVQHPRIESVFATASSVAVGTEGAQRAARVSNSAADRGAAPTVPGAPQAAQVAPAARRRARRLPNSLVIMCFAATATCRGMQRPSDTVADWLGLKDSRAGSWSGSTNRPSSLSKR